MMTTTKKREHAMAALIPTPSGNIAQSIFAKLATHYYEQGHSGAEAIAFAEEQAIRLYPRSGFKPQYAPKARTLPADHTDH